ncbi:SDR family oxidoreductase [Roseateles sp. DAIF2]|uniref:SDR family oxidoreductase n=1 Tax=Roseateles sp. DAIF2 TaxID=2714952 RepID=UPI0018A2DE1E|nr:SDR family oxidoreductase [Roseateles sp. DAIF2]QPF71743.1 SDR family oxidoreductase [Roseateles sp. DAIF2]
MTFSLQGQTVAVLGGSSGIGLAVARGALAAGASTWIAGRDPQRLAAAVAATPGLRSAALDIGDGPALAAFFERIGGLDHLVVTAGASIGAAPLGELDLAGAAREALDVKLLGSLRAAQQALPWLRPGGSIGFTSGMLARKPTPNALVKTVINAGLEAAVRQLARELAPRLRVYAVSPGPVDTPGWSFPDAASRAEKFRQLGAGLPLGYTATAEETAAAYLFAMGARGLTGAVLDLDSGATLG